MAARFVKPLFATLDRGTGVTDTPRLQVISNSGAGTPPVLPEPKTGAGERGHAAPPQSAKSFDDRSIKVQRDDQALAKVPGDAPLPPEEKSSNSGVAKDLRNDKIVIEDLEREHEFRTALELMANARGRTHGDETLDTKTIIGIAAAVIALGLGFTALLPSILTRDPVGPTAALVISPAPARAVQTERPEAAQAAPAPRPAQLPEAAPPPPVPNATSVAKTAPALRGSSPSEAKVGGIALTAAEKAAVARGLQELEKRAAVTTPRRAASTRPPLTDEEKAAVERGLRELEKTAEQAKP